MLIPIALVVFLMVTTAIIAPWSDNLGKKLGKKRVSVFGLRPRTSATILTIASSWGIMGFTLLALLVTVKPLRHALLYYEKERDQAQKDTATLKGTVGALKGDVLVAQNDLKAAKEQRANYQTQAANYKGQVTIYRNDARKFQDEAKRAQQNFQNAKRGEQNARRATQAAQQRQQRAVAALTRAQQELGSSQDQLANTKEDLGRKREQIKRAQEELKRKQTQVRVAQAQVRVAQAQQKSAQQKRIEADAAAFRAAAVVYRLGGQVVRLGTQVVTLQKQADELKLNTERATAIALSSSNEADFLSLNDIRLPVDQTLAERRIDAGQSSQQIERELQILLESSKTATEAAMPGAKFSARVIVVDPQTKEPLQLEGADAVQLYARLLSATNQTVSARLASSVNYPANSPLVVARFVFVPIRTIYAARQNIAQTTIDAGKNRSGIFGDLQKLVEEARVNAVKNGASPPLPLALSSNDRNFFFDGDTGPKLFDAVDQVKKVGHPVSVRIVAARDLDSAEPLQVRFLVGDNTA